jgi:hypothetical protein
VRELRRSWWVGLALIPMGWLSWTAFLYAGLKARRRRWLLYSAIYLALAIFGVVFIDDERWPEWATSLALIAIVASWGGAFVHALVIRSQFLDSQGVGDRVDANRVGLAEISRLPGFDDAMAERIVAVRNEVGGYSSAHEAGHLLDLPPDVVEELGDRAVFISKSPR